jgi:hypothetical protein
MDPAKRYVMVQTSSGWFGRHVGDVGDAACRSDTSAVSAELKGDTLHLDVHLSCEFRDETDHTEAIEKWKCQLAKKGVPVCEIEEIDVPVAPDEEDVDE